jgi:hypothetical protein
MDEITEVPDKGLSRRRVIKGIGAGTAVAWAAPTVLGVGPAFAADASAVAPQRCDGCNPADPCLGQSACGDPEFNCTCKPPEVGEGNPCVCTGNGSCDSFQQCPGGQGDCPPGYTCTSSCCDGFGYPRLCLPNCGQVAAAGAAAGGGPRTDGK